MRKEPIESEQRKQLVALQSELTKIRSLLDISAPGEYLAHEYDGSDTLLVEADGFGGATLKKVSDGFPFNHNEDCALSFKTEAEACHALDYYFNTICGGEESDDEMDFVNFLDAIEHGVIDLSKKSEEKKEDV